MIAKMAMKDCHQLSHLLEHAVWEEDMVKEEKIVITCTAPEFIEMMTPLFKSRLWTVNGRRKYDPLFRALSNVFVVVSPNTGKSIEFVSIIDAFNRYVDQHKL